MSGVGKSEHDAAGEIIRTYSNLFTSDPRMSEFFKRAQQNWYQLKTSEKSTDRIFLYKFHYEPAMMKILLKNKVYGNNAVASQFTMIIRRFRSLHKSRNLSNSMKLATMMSLFCFLDSGIEPPDNQKEHLKKFPVFDDFFPAAETFDDLTSRIDGDICDMDFSSLSENAVSISDECYDFTISTVFCPKDNLNERYDKYSPLLSFAGTKCSLVLPGRRLVVYFNTFTTRIDTGFDVTPNKWHSCQLSLSHAAKRLEVIFDGQHKSFALPRGFKSRMLTIFVYRGIKAKLEFTNSRVSRSFNGIIRHVRIYPFALEKDALTALASEVSRKLKK